MWNFICNFLVSKDPGQGLKVRPFLKLQNFQHFETGHLVLQKKFVQKLHSDDFCELLQMKMQRVLSFGNFCCNFVLEPRKSEQKIIHQTKTINKGVCLKPGSLKPFQDANLNEKRRDVCFFFKRNGRNERDGNDMGICQVLRAWAKNCREASESVLREAFGFGRYHFSSHQGIGVEKNAKSATSACLKAAVVASQKRFSIENIEKFASTW